MDLSLILLEEIIEEFKKRYDVFIFAYVSKANTKEEDVLLQYHGGKISCVGLSELMKYKLMQQLSDEIENDL